MTAISKTIRKRIEDAGARYWANDNISQFIEPNEVEPLIEEVTTKFQSVLESLIIDTEKDPNSAGTAKRLAKMYINEIMSGRYSPQPDVTAFPNEYEGNLQYDGLLVVRADIVSMCSHHHQTVKGTAWVGIVPNKKVLGLSKYIRLVQWMAKRGTLQEQLCTDIAHSLSEIIECPDVAVYIEARHGCCENRGVSAHNSLTQTTTLLGQFLEGTKLRTEFYENVKMSKMMRND